MRISIGILLILSIHVHQVWKTFVSMAIQISFQICILTRAAFRKCIIIHASFVIKLLLNGLIKQIPENITNGNFWIKCLWNSMTFIFLWGIYNAWNIYTKQKAVPKHGTQNKRGKNWLKNITVFSQIYINCNTAIHIFWDFKTSQNLVYYF